MKAKGILLTAIISGSIFTLLTVMSFSRGGESSVVRKYYTEAKKNDPAIDALLEDWEKLEAEETELRNRHMGIMNQSNEFYREANLYVKEIKDPELKAQVEKSIAASQAAYNVKVSEIEKQNQEIAKMLKERADHEMALMLTASMKELAKAQQGMKADAAKLSDISKKHDEIKTRAKNLIK